MLSGGIAPLIWGMNGNSISKSTPCPRTPYGVLLLPPQGGGSHEDATCTESTGIKSFEERDKANMFDTYWTPIHLTFRTGCITFQRAARRRSPP